MGRKLKASEFDTRAARDKLKRRGKPYYRMIDPGLHLGYRKPLKGAGKWVMRLYEGKQAYKVEVIETADDFSDANGADILDFKQAQDRAREIRDGRARSAAGLETAAPLTVQQACERYVEYLRAHRKTADDADGRLKKHILP